MTPMNGLALDTSAATGNTGPWINTSHLDPDWSLHVVGLEAGGTIKVLASNSLTVPPTPTDPTAAVLATITGATGGAPSINPFSTNSAWLQLVKTPGSGPTTTVVRLSGRLF